MRKFSKIPLIISAVVLLAAGCSGAKPQSNDQPVPQQQEQQSGVPQAPAITVTQTVEGSNFNKPANTVPEGENAIDLLKRDHQVELKNYPGVGDFVVSIDGIKPDSKRFWAFYVNGQSSSVGASQYKPKNGDKVEWKLEAIK